MKNIASHFPSHLLARSSLPQLRHFFLLKLPLLIKRFHCAGLWLHVIAENVTQNPIARYELTSRCGLLHGNRRLCQTMCRP